MIQILGQDPDPVPFNLFCFQPEPHKRIRSSCRVLKIIKR
jgi:hypothetical protein